MAKRTKKFKTIMGYLRSHGNPDADGERKVINHLLPQMGVDDPILPEETPREGLERLLQVHTEPRAVATLQDCLKWLGRVKRELTVGEEVFVSGSSSYEPGGMLAPYLVCGFPRGDTKSNVSIIVDGCMVEEAGQEGDPIASAERIAGPGYCFHTTMNLDKPVPDEAKNTLFMSDKELYAAAPELNPRRRASRRRGAAA